MSKNPILLCALIFIGCTDAPPEKLYGDYYFAQTNGYNNYIIKNNKFIVDSHIDSLEVINCFAFGLRSKSKNPDGKELSENYGHFSLNMANGILTESIAEDSFNSMKRMAANKEVNSCLPDFSNKQTESTEQTP